MADRLDFYFRQRVTEAELDLAFELLEKADRNLAVDFGFRGIISGAEPSPHAPIPDLTLDLTGPATAYDSLGQRIFYGTGQNVDCSVDLVGNPTAVTTPGNERWLAVFLEFDRALSDPRTDGNSQQVFFRRNESFRILVRQAIEAPIGTAPRVELQPDELLVCDVRLVHGQSQIFSSSIDVTRRQAFVLTQGSVVAAQTSGWSVLAPLQATVQSTLNEVDSVLASHFSGGTPRHAASHVDYTPHSYVGATNVQSAIDELVDDLQSSTAGSPGAIRIGADAVSGSPSSLAAGTVDAQLASLLGFINAHQNASSGAHPANAVSAAPHNYLASTNVQAQLEELVNALLASSAPSGAQRVGAAAQGFLTAATVQAQLEQLVTALAATTAPSGASRIGVADPAGLLNATNVEAALQEILEAFDDGHFRFNEANAGQHRAIIQPALAASGRVLVFDARGIGSSRARFRIFADQEGIWFTLNAGWNGSEWVRDTDLYTSGGIHITHNRFEIVHENDPDNITFPDFNVAWILDIGSGASSFRTVGPVMEMGKLGFEWDNPGTTTQSLGMGSAVSYRSTFASAPSSITFLGTSISPGFSGVPNVWDPNEYGFGYYSFQSMGPGVEMYWWGTYTAVA